MEDAARPLTAAARRHGALLAAAVVALSGYLAGRTLLEHASAGLAVRGAPAGLAALLPLPACLALAAAGGWAALAPAALTAWLAAGLAAYALLYAAIALAEELVFRGTLLGLLTGEGAARAPAATAPNHCRLRLTVCSHYDSRPMGTREARLARFALPALVALLTGVACSTSASPEQVKTGADIVIGVPNAATGDYNVEGPLTKQGYDLWMDWTNARGGVEVNGVRHRVRLVYADDQSSPQLSAQLAERLLTGDKASFLLGPYGSPTAATVAAVAEKHQVPLVAPSAGARQVFMQGFHYTFGVLAPVDQYPAAVIDWELTLIPKPTTMAILSADDVTSLLITQGTADYANSHGIKVVYLQKYPAGTTNLFNLVQQVKAIKPDIFFNSGHFLEAVAAHKAAKELALDVKLFSYAVGPQQPEFVQALGPVADYSVTASPWTAQAKFKAEYGPTTAEYVAAFRKKYQTDKEPGFVTADATAAGLTLELAIKHAKSLDPQKVRDALASLDANTFYGRLKFDAQGQNTFHNVLVMQIQSGQLQTVWPPELASGAGLYPAPTWESRFGVAAAPPKAKLPGTGEPPRKK